MQNSAPRGPRMMGPDGTVYEIPDSGNVAECAEVTREITDSDAATRAESGDAGGCFSYSGRRMPAEVGPCFSYSVRRMPGEVAPCFSYSRLPGETSPCFSFRAGPPPRQMPVVGPCFSFPADVVLPRMPETGPCFKY